MSGGVAAPLAVYVHFPWCLEKCPYCDFVSFKTERGAIDHEGYADAVIAELGARAAWVAGHRVETIFFGGGTPSLWDADALGRVLAAIVERLPTVDRDALEVTVECNPTSLDRAAARRLVGVGVNRLSIGVQSLDDAQLRYLGRLHDRPLALAAIDAAVAEAPRVSADLIFALPDQPPEVAAAHARSLVERGLSHLSAYALTIEEGTRFGELARRGRLPLATEDATADAFLAIEAALDALGLAHYEVSNYARPGEEARHNLAYWRGHAYLGLGTAAYGCAPIGEGMRVRYRNEPDPARYVKAARALEAGAPREGDGLTQTLEPIDAETQLREQIMLGLRLDEGLSLEAAGRALGLPPASVLTADRARAIARLIDERMIERVGDRIRVAPSRRLATDGIAMRLF
jgi:putative oxygen-independent coproporphyrinogen III oxidase